MAERGVGRIGSQCLGRGRVVGGGDEVEVEIGEVVL
jgi:hypothetical protein